MVLSRSHTAKILLSTLALISVGCSRDIQTITTKDRTLPVVTKPLAPTPSAKVTVAKKSPQPNYFELALDKASSAAIISQSAPSPEDWRLVVSQLQEAIALMKAVPASSPQKVIAKAKIAQYQRQIAHAQQYTRTENIAPATNVLPKAPPEISSLATATTEVPQLSQQVFQAQIKRRASGTPVIDVTFNNSQQVEMIVDTGASGTVITQQTAAALGVLPVAKAKANTASDTDVEFSIGYVDSIEIGGAQILDVPVAIAPSPQLEIGLLGHDFFGNYDVTIKRDVVEFRPR